MLLTKLHIPPAGNNLVQRSELYEKLNTGFNRKLILISAPAGFGKTTVVCSWVHQYKIPTAWYSLDKGDNDPVEFLSYIISAIQNIQQDFGLNTLSLLKSPNKPSNESIINLLINEILSIKENFLLAFDDFHLISNDDIAELISYLLEYIPDNLHIAILTRSDPALAVAKLRSQHQLIELRASDLSFSANDISILFNKKLRIGLSIEDIYALETKTEGWIAGLQLTALSMQGLEDTSKFIRDLKGDNRYIMDYLIEEVLKIQPEDIKEFLLQTSLLEQLSAPLCNEVLNRNDSQFILEQLEKNNMFVIPLDSERNWYRYHHLFAELLKQRLYLRDKAFVGALHNKACDWFEQNKFYELAIDHAFEINDFERSIQLLGEIVEAMWENGQHAAIVKYGDSLPVELINNNSEFCLYYSWILISSGQILKAEPFLASAEKKTRKIIIDANSSKEDIQFNLKLLGKISVAFAYLNSHQEHSEKTFEYCKTAMDNLSQDDPFWFSWAWFSYAIAYFSNGNFHESNGAFDKAFEFAKKTGNIYLLSTIAIRMAENEQVLGHYTSAFNKCMHLMNLLKDRGYSQLTKSEGSYAALYFILASTHIMWAEMEKGVECAKIAYNLSNNTGDIFLKVFILMLYPFALKESGDTLEAEKKIIELDELLKQHDIPPYLKSMYIGWRIHFYIENNQFDEANNFIIENGFDPDKLKTPTNDSAYGAYARLLLLQGKLDEAELLISELYPLVCEGKRVERMIELKILYVVLYTKKLDKEKALANLIDAMEIAADENLISFFAYNNDLIDTGLLEEVFKKHAKTNIPDKFINNVKSALERRTKVKKAGIGIDLSTREMDILRLIPEDLSNQEIADKLFISLNTVKTHLKNIYLKLETDSRTKTIAKAKELGLI